MSTMAGSNSPAAGIKTTADQPVRLRYWEVDVLRGVAVVMMVVYHLMWDLWFFQIVADEQFWNPFWRYWQRTTASTFLILVGVSLTLTYRRLAVPNYRVFLKRGLRIFGLGLLITLVMTFSGIGVIDFGILHLIGFSILVAYPLLRHTWLNLWLGLLLIAMGGMVQSMNWPGVWVSLPANASGGWPIWIDGRGLAPLGNVPPGYAAVDFFPVLPWFGVVLLGVWLGNCVYTAKGRRFRIPDWGDLAPARALESFGRNSLLMYLIHQPLLFAFLFVFGVAHF